MTRPSHESSACEAPTPPPLAPAEGDVGEVSADLPTEAAWLAEQERMREIKAIPVPPDTKISPLVYRHMAYHAARNRDVLRRHVTYRLPWNPNLMDPDDVVQEAFYEVLTSADRRGTVFGDSEAGIKVLFGVARYQILKAWQTARQKRENESNYGELPRAIEGVDEDIDVQTLDALFGNDIALAMGERLGKLGEQRQRIFDELLRDPDRKGTEIAEVLGMTAATYRSTRRGLTNTIRRQLETRLKREGLLARDKPVFDLAGNPAPAEEKIRPKVISINASTAQILRAAGGYREAGERSVAPIIPPYIGQWAVAAQDIRVQLKKWDGRGSAIIVYPYPHCLGDFTRYMTGLLADQAEAVEIFTPDEVVPKYLEGHFFDYVALTEEVPAHLREQLRSHTRFMLRLLSEEPTGLVNNLYPARTYRQAGGAYLNWTRGDSIRYLQEWRFATGTQMTEEDAERMASQGQGPGVRRLCQGIGSFLAVQAEAGYSFGRVEATKEKGPKP